MSSSTGSAGSSTSATFTGLDASTAFSNAASSFMNFTGVLSLTSVRRFSIVFRGTPPAETQRIATNTGGIPSGVTETAASAARARAASASPLALLPGLNCQCGRSAVASDTVPGTTSEEKISGLTTADDIHTPTTPKQGGGLATILPDSPAKDTESIRISRQQTPPKGRLHCLKRHSISTTLTGTPNTTIDVSHCQYREYGKSVRWEHTTHPTPTAGGGSGHVSSGLTPVSYRRPARSPPRAAAISLSQRAAGRSLGTAAHALSATLWQW